MEKDKLVDGLGGEGRRGKEHEPPQYTMCRDWGSVGRTGSASVSAILSYRFGDRGVEKQVGW
jgi:hypothetical protein